MTRDSLLHVSGWAERKGQRRGVVLVGLTIAVFFLLFRQIDGVAVREALQHIPPKAWATATLLTLSFPLLSALRWQLTLRAIGHRVPFTRCLTIILGVSPISAIAPSKAGDLLKAISLRGDVGILEVGGTVLTERAIDVITLALLALLGSIAVGNVLITRLAAAIVAVGSIGLVLLPHLVASVPKPALRDTLERVIRILHALRKRPVLALGVVALTGFNWFASVAQTHMLLHAVGATTPFLLTTAALPIAIFVGLLPITVGGMGTRDAALVTLLAPTATSPQALSVGLLYSFFGYWLLAILGLPFLRAALFAQRTPRDGS